MPDNKLLSLTEIFNQKFFRIPDYQRGYSWDNGQLMDFWNDLKNLKNDKVHYTGLLTVKSVRKADIINNSGWHDDQWLFEKGLSAFYLIDGQQRLTTSIIFINQLLENFQNDEGVNFDSRKNWEKRFLFDEFEGRYKSFIFGYEKDNPSDEYFKTKILGQYSPTSDKVPEQTLYTANLENAKQFFNGKLKDMDKSQMEELFKRLVNRFKFNFYELDDDLDEYVTFETMNNRGKPLTTLELLKNRLIYLSTLLEENTDVKNRLRKDINESWKTIYEYLGKNKALGDDVFLYNHWIMFYTYDRSEADVYANFLLHSKFTPSEVQNGKLDFKEIQEYVYSLAKSVKSWFYIHNIEYSSFSMDIKEWMQKLERLNFGAFPPLLMAVLNKEADSDKISTLLKSAERFLFLVFKVSQRQSNTKNSHFYRLANTYYNGSDYWPTKQPTTIDNVINDIKWHTDGETENGDYVGMFELSKFLNCINELDKKEEGYYSWNGLRYFLYEYELHLQIEANNNEKVSWTDFNGRKKEDTIEHIYPQTAKEQSWKTAFKEADEKQKKALLHSLGNLVLLAKAKNSSLQNKGFDHKRKHESSPGIFSGFYNGSYSEIEVAGFAEWSPSEIRERGLKMLKFMEARWGFNCADWEISQNDLLNIKNQELRILN